MINTTMILAEEFKAGDEVRFGENGNILKVTEVKPYPGPEYWVTLVVSHPSSGQVGEFTFNRNQPLRKVI